MRRIITLPIIIFIGLTLSGCGNVWVHNFKGEPEFHGDKNSCLAEASRVYPKAISPPTYLSTRTNCSGDSDRMNCTSTPSYSYSDNIDTNRFARSRYYDSCMKSMGWRVDQKKKSTPSDDGASLSSKLKGLF